MPIAGFILQIFAAVMLLLFAVGLVRSGIERRFGQHFARFQTGRGSAPAAAAYGMGLAVMLQSAAAVALLLCGFAATGSIPARFS